MIGVSHITHAFSSETVPMRDKEIKQDYRFMPEPNLPPLHLYTSDTVDPAKSGEVVLIDKLGEEIPALPGSIRERLMEAHGLSLYEASAIVVGLYLSLGMGKTTIWVSHEV